MISDMYGSEEMEIFQRAIHESQTQGKIFIRV